jgi:hypothetical protein
MPKYYVQSGNLEMILQAHDSRCAAIWAIHRTLSPSLTFLREEAGERGFDRNGGDVFETLEIVTEWNRLLVALDRLQASTDDMPPSGESSGFLAA